MSKNVWDSIDELFDNSNRNENELDQNVLLGIEDDDYELFMSKEQEDEVKEVNKEESRSKEEFIENENNKTIDENVTNGVNIEQDIEIERNIKIKDNSESEELNNEVFDKDENEVIEENEMKNDVNEKETLDDNNVDERDDVLLTTDKSPSNVNDDIHDITESSNQHRSNKTEFDEDDEDDDEINKSATRDKRWSERSEEENLNKSLTTNLNTNNNNNNNRNNNSNQQFHNQKPNFMNRQDMNRNKNKMIEQHNQFMQNRPRFNYPNMQIPGLPPPPLHSHLMDQPPPLQFPFSQPPPPPFSSFHQSAPSYILPFPNAPNPIMFQDMSLHHPPPQHGPSQLMNPHLMMHRPPLIERPPLLHMHPPHLLPSPQAPNNSTSQMASGGPPSLSLPPQQNSFYFNNQNQSLIPPLSDSLEEILRQQVNRHDTMYKSGQPLMQQSDNRNENRPYRRENFSNNQNFTDLNRVSPDQRHQPLMEQNVRKRVSDQGINKPPLVRETSNQQKPNNNNPDPPNKIKKMYNGQLMNENKSTEKIKNENDQQTTSPASSTTTPAPVVVIDDPEYIKKLEEQKRKREEILKLKELKRAQRIKELNVKKQTIDSEPITNTAVSTTFKSTNDMQETNNNIKFETETSLVKPQLNTARRIQVINETAVKQEPSKSFNSSIKTELMTIETNSIVNNKPEVKFELKVDQTQRSVVSDPVNNSNVEPTTQQNNNNFNDPFHTRNYSSPTQNSENYNQTTRSFQNSTSSNPLYRPFLANYHEHQQLYQYNAKLPSTTYQYVRNPYVYQLNNKSQNMKILNSNNNNNNNTNQNIDNNQNQVKNNINFQIQNQQQQKKSTPITVILQNISTSTSEKSIYDMCNVLHIKDKVMKITMENSLNKAEIMFSERDSADKFFKQYNRTLVDLSIITVKLL